MPRVSPEWADGLACPHCGRPLRWIGRWRRDFNSPDGYSFERETHTWVVDARVAPDDREVRSVESRGAGTGRARLRYEHTCELRCARCSKEYSQSQASHRTVDAGRVPAGYYLDALGG